MSRLKIFKNRYYEMKAHVRKMFPRCYHIWKIILIFEKKVEFFSSFFHAFFMHNLLRNSALKLQPQTIFFKKLISISRLLRTSLWKPPLEQSFIMEISIWNPEHRKLDFNITARRMVINILWRFNFEALQKGGIRESIFPIHEIFFNELCTKIR